MSIAPLLVTRPSIPPAMPLPDWDHVPPAFRDAPCRWKAWLPSESASLTREARTRAIQFSQLLPIRLPPPSCLRAARHPGRPLFHRLKSDPHFTAEPSDVAMCAIQSSCSVEPPCHF